MENEEELSPVEQEQLKELVKEYGSPNPEEKHNQHVFLSKVAEATDNTKTGNLKDDELGYTRFSLRSYKEMELVARQLQLNNTWADYFQAKGQILTATSLSRAGFLTNLAVIQRKQIEDMNLSNSAKPNSGWFRKKDKSVTGGN
jgi:hypothetical protein